MACTPQRFIVASDRPPSGRGPRDYAAHLALHVAQDLITGVGERQNLSVRMASQRFTRRTNGFSKKAAIHAAAVSLYVGHYNWCPVHEALRTTPAHALGLINHVWSVAELLEVVTTRLPEPPAAATSKRPLCLAGVYGGMRSCAVWPSEGSSPCTRIGY